MTKFSECVHKQKIKSIFLTKSGKTLYIPSKQCLFEINFWHLAHKNCRHSSFDINMESFCYMVLNLFSHHHGKFMALGGIVILNNPLYSLDLAPKDFSSSIFETSIKRRAIFYSRHSKPCQQDFSCDTKKTLVSISFSRTLPS